METEEQPITTACAGSYIGTLSWPPIKDSTVATLRASVAYQMGINTEQAASIKLILGGRTLKDDTQPLAQLRVTPTTRLMVLYSAPAGDALQQEEARRARLENIKRTAETMAMRDGSHYSSTEQREFVIENQGGTALQFASETDRQGLVTGLMLHAKGVGTMRQGDYRTALDELLMAEEALDLCSPTVLQGVDNVALLLVDIVWCMFKLNDLSRLPAAAARLRRARTSLIQSYGADLQRARVLHGNFQPELATFVRLEVLEGVAAYHMNNTLEAKRSLLSAQQKYNKLQVSDEALIQLLQLGFSHKEATRALRFNEGDVQRAAAFCVETRQQQAARREQEREHRVKRRKQMQLGQTVKGRYVSLDALTRLTEGGLGYQEEVAVAALQKADNDVNEALDILSNPQQFEVLQLSLTKKKDKGKQKTNVQVDEDVVHGLMMMGFLADKARAALQAAGGDQVAALDALMGMGEEARDYETVGGRGGVGAAGSWGNGAGDAAGSSGIGKGGVAGPSGSGAGPSSGGGGHQDAVVNVEEETLDAALMEELEGNVSHNDPLEAYDVEIQEEGALLEKYLELVCASS